MIIYQGIVLIDSWHVIPYGLAGFIAKTITGVPQILRHGGSDLGRVYKDPEYRPLLDTIFRGVDAIVTNCHVKPFFLSLGVPRERLFEINDVPVNLDAFNPNVEPFDLEAHLGVEVPDVPVITYLGKVACRSETKGIYELTEALAGITQDFRLLFVAEGLEMPRLREAVEQSGLTAKTLFMDFVPPWLAPSIIRRSTCTVTVERNFPIPFHVPIVPKEVMAAGRCVIMSEEIHSKVPYKDLVHGETALIVNPLNIEQFRSTLESVIRDPSTAGSIGANARRYMEQTNDFPAYVKLNEDIYCAVLQNAGQSD